MTKDGLLFPSPYYPTILPTTTSSSIYLTKQTTLCRGMLSNHNIVKITMSLQMTTNEDQVSLTYHLKCDDNMVPPTSSVRLKIGRVFQSGSMIVSNCDAGDAQDSTSKDADNAADDSTSDPRLTASAGVYASYTIPKHNKPTPLSQLMTHRKNNHGGHYRSDTEVLQQRPSRPRRPESSGRGLGNYPPGGIRYDGFKRKKVTRNSPLHGSVSYRREHHLQEARCWPNDSDWRWHPTYSPPRRSTFRSPQSPPRQSSAPCQRPPCIIRLMGDLE